MNGNIITTFQSKQRGGGGGGATAVEIIGCCVECVCQGRDIPRPAGCVISSLKFEMAH